MNEDSRNHPEDHLLHELLREQTRRPDLRLLHRIEAAIDHCSAPAKPRFNPALLARVATIAFIAGGAIWLTWQKQPEHETPVVAAPESFDDLPVPGVPGSIALRRGLNDDSAPSSRKAPPAPDVPHPFSRPESTPGFPEQNGSNFATLGNLTPDTMKGGLDGKAGRFAVHAKTSGASAQSGPQPWKNPLAQPLSIVPLQVDTASYVNVCRMILSGREVPAEAVRIEECINAFHYDDAAPKGNAPVSVGSTITSCPWNPANHLIRVTIKGREISGEKRGPVASGVGLEVEFNPAMVAGYRLLGYEDGAFANDGSSRNAKQNAETIHAGDTATAFYEITPAIAPAPSSNDLKYVLRTVNPEVNDEWLTVKLRFKQGSKSVKTESALQGTAASFENADADFRFATAAAMFGMKLAGAKEVATTPWPRILAIAQDAAGNAEDRAGLVAVLEKLAGSPVRQIRRQPAIMTDVPLKKPK
ncbi:MAG: von Willebrand factor type A domain-containing protein [Verrucomicrobiota bacterium]